MPQTKQEKRAMVTKLATSRAARTPAQQLKLLDTRPGNAKKERARLLKEK